ncbi:MAG TPA: polysaccharide biosynthesis tyrosine autokinase [Thiothrix sp.]|nr:polysaccharide biosynthesis tyrosine autokinase [Thiothrix sp.]
MNGQQNNQIITIGENRGIDTRGHYQSAPIIDRAGYQDAGVDDEIDLKAIFSIIFKHKKTILFSVILAAIITFLYTSTMIPIYRATVSIKIDAEADTLAQYDNVFKEKEVDRNFHSTQYDLLQSRVLARRVIDKLELEDSLRKIGEMKPFYSGYFAEVKAFFSQKIIQPIFGNTSVLESVSSGQNEAREEWEAKMGTRPIELAFLEKLSLSPSKRSNILEINYDSYDPQLAAASVNTLAEEFIQMNLQGGAESSAYAKEYLVKQLVIAKRSLQESEAKLASYAREKNIISTGEGESIVGKELKGLSDAYIEAQKDFITAESEYEQRKKASGRLRTMDNPVIQQLKKRQGELEAQYQQQLQLYKPAFPAMIQLKHEIADLGRQLEAESKNIDKNVKNDLEAKYLAAKQKAEKLLKELKDKKTELLGQQDKSIGYSTLQREVKTNRELYDSLLQRKKEVDIAEGVVRNNVSIIDPAFVPYRKHSPNTMQNMLIGTMLGLMLGMAIAFIRESFDVRIHNTDDLEDISDLPVLGIFPFVKGKNKKKGRSAEGAILLTENPQSTEYEAFCSLVTNLGYIGSQGEIPKIIHVTSSAPAEGKSNVAINTASILAESNLKVLLIDADLRKPRVDSYLGIQVENGLAEYLVNRCQIDDVISDSAIENLSIITAGVPVPSPVKLLAEDRMIELLEYAGEEYDHIIIDSPPVLGLADALILSNRSDVTLFVVASDETKRPHLLDALKRLRLGYGNVAGFILTKVKSSKSDYYAHDSYYGYQRDDVLKLGRAG